MEELEKSIPIWPSIKEQHRHYSKIDTERDLDYIAKNVTRTTRPLATLEPPTQGNFVAKRFGSVSWQTWHLVSDVNQDLLQRFKPRSEVHSGDGAG